MTRAVLRYFFWLGFGLSIVGCGGVESKVPEWVPVEADFVAGRGLPANITGHWRLNKPMSDDPAEVLQDRIRELRPPRVPGQRPGAGQRIDGEGPQFGFAGLGMDKDMFTEPRLRVLQAKDLTISKQENGLTFTFDRHAPVTYLTNGQPSSSDNNINITLADWEGSHFVVEKNGPRGMVLERWILSPDRSQLYVKVTVEMPLVREPLVIGRLFDAVDHAR